MVLKKDPAMYFFSFFIISLGDLGDYMVFTGGRSGGQSSPTAYKEWTLENCE